MSALTEGRARSLAGECRLEKGLGHQVTPQPHLASEETEAKRTTCLHLPGTAPRVYSPTSRSRSPKEGPVLSCFHTRERRPGGSGPGVPHWVMEAGVGTLAPWPTLPARKLGCFYATHYKPGDPGKGTCDSSGVQVRPRALSLAASLAEVLEPDHQVVHQGPPQTGGPRRGCLGVQGCTAPPPALLPRLGAPAFPAESGPLLTGPESLARGSHAPGGAFGTRFEFSSSGMSGNARDSSGISAGCRSQRLSQSRPPLLNQVGPVPPTPHQ